MKRSHVNRSILTFCWVVFLAGCGSDDISDLKEYLAEIKGKNKGTIEPLPEIKAVESFTFTGRDLRDPFVPDEKSLDTDEEKVENGIRPDVARPKEELESYELDSLRMVGTVDKSSTLWALIKANDGTIHRVQVGNYMGRNYGKIVNIKENHIELVEIVSDSPNSWFERKAGIDLVESRGVK